MEQNSQMTPEQSLRIINETLNINRRAIVKNSGNYFILWGSLLSVVALAVYLLWSNTGSPAWNFLWFAMPFLGCPLAAITGKRMDKVPSSFVGNLLGWIWSIFGTFAIVISVISLIWGAPASITTLIILLFGFAEAVSGAVLKNWPIIIAGVLTGIVGTFISVELLLASEQILIFVIAGVILALTGVYIKFISK